MKKIFTQGLLTANILVFSSVALAGFGEKNGILRQVKALRLVPPLQYTKALNILARHLIPRKHPLL
ncbi:hypothetical protein HNQ69_000516 [Bartonella callosciuri]|uniref:Uncharacterized protein n=1 Tax=Bartonella callosciuri TaxID=686223 RepID=A0A840NTW3_9HYPH|nr:hypothetical protein [Bartonella callosciuri]